VRVFVSFIFAILAGTPTLAWADTDLFSRDTISGLVDLRVAASAGERSSDDGGFGKTRFSGSKDGVAIRGQVADADLLWNPSIGDVSAVIDLESQPNAYHAVDLAQGYLLYKPVPTSDLRFSARAGFFYPPISMEHEGYGGAAWAVANTITPSAINSWIGEEVKVFGGEATVRETVADHAFGASVGLFGYDDTAGSLLALRGWSFTDEKGTAFARIPLPPLNSFIDRRQAAFTEPVQNLDARLGYYVRLDWTLPSRLALNAVYYNNGGDKTSVDQHQWSWATRFWNLGARYDIDERTWLIAQAMTGQTKMGFSRGAGVWVDVDFQSAFLLATHSFGRGGITGRIDWFSTSSPLLNPREDYGEKGAAVTADYKFALTRNVTLLAEVLQVWSDRPARAVAALDADQSQTTVQASARLAF
jgi:hypothetical protein